MVTDDRSGLSDYLAAFCDTGAAPDDSLALCWIARWGELLRDDLLLIRPMGIVGRVRRRSPQRANQRCPSERYQYSRN